MPINEPKISSVIGCSFKAAIAGAVYMREPNLGAVSIRKTVLPGMAIPMLKIRRPNGRLIFNMGIPIPGKTVFYIETGPWSSYASLYLQ